MVSQAKTATFEQLADSGGQRFHHLDAALATALIKTVPSQLRIRIQKKEDELIKVAKVIKGRQVVWMVYDWFRTKPHMQSHHGYQDLNALTWKGDAPAEMEYFLQQWDYYVSKITDTKLASAEVLRDLMYEKMKGSKVLAVELAHFKRARAKGDTPDGAPVDPDFCLEFLRNTIETYIYDEREDKNLEGIRKAVTATGSGGALERIDGAPGPKSPNKPKKEPKKTPKPPKTAASTPAAEGGGGGGNQQSNPKPKRWCYFFNKGLRDGGKTKCPRGDKCSFPMIA